MSDFMAGFCVGLLAAILGIVTAGYFAKPYYSERVKYGCPLHSLNQEFLNSTTIKGELKCYYHVSPIKTKKFKGI